jgi:Flp pilus assembly pilin Flp
MIAKLTVKMLMALNELKRDEKGAMFIEYALVTGLIAVVTAGAAITFQAQLAAVFTRLGASVDLLLP